MTLSSSPLLICRLPPYTRGSRFELAHNDSDLLRFDPPGVDTLVVVGYGP